MAEKLTHEEFAARLRSLTPDLVPIDRYVNAATKIRFQCPYGHVFDMLPRGLLRNKSCPICSRRRIVTGYNDLWAVRPDIATMLEDKQLGLSVGVGSSQKAKFICPNCGNVVERTINKVVSRGFLCPHCDDGVSFPNKVLQFILSNSGVDAVHFEFSPKWANGRRYDGYFEKCGQGYVVEMDGGVGHGHRKFKSEKRDYDSVSVDAKKDLLARSHGLTIFRIDCNYPEVATRFSYIRENLFKSGLSSIIDLSAINWQECFRYASRSFVLSAVALYNDGHSIKDIHTQMHVDRHTVRVWLKQATEIGLCNYDPQESCQRTTRSLPPNTQPVDQFTADGVFIKTFISVADAQRATHVNNISACLRGIQQYAGGYIWKRHCTNSNSLDLADTNCA